MKEKRKDGSLIEKMAEEREIMDINNKFENAEIDDNKLIYLTDEDGNDVLFEFLDLIEYDSEKYVVLLPIDEDTDEVVIFKVEEDQIGDEKSYTGVEDQVVLDAIFRIFKDRFRDEFDFID